jgi:hypothetical protein
LASKSAGAALAMPRLKTVEAEACIRQASSIQPAL